MCIRDSNIAYYVTYMRLKDYDVTTQIPAMSIVERLGKKLYRCIHDSQLK